jgi:hypothetical protein
MSGLTATLTIYRNLTIRREEVHSLVPPIAKNGDVTPALMPMLKVLYCPLPPNTLAVDVPDDIVVSAVVVVVTVLALSVCALTIPAVNKAATDKAAVFFNVE